MNEIIRNMSMEAYRARPGAHATALWRLVSQSPSHYRYAEDHPEPPTEAMLLGTALHVRVLEPEAFEARYLVCDGPVNPKTGKPFGRETKAWAEWRAGIGGGQEILSEADGERLRAMAERVLYHDTARGLLELPAENEMSLFWTDEETGLPCKARLDRVILGRQIADLKSCRNAKRNAFERECAERGYFMQPAFYRDALAREIGPESVPLLPVLIAVEKEPPFEVAVHRLSQEALDYGREQYQQALRRLAECERTGRWPGYEGEYEINPPKWARNETIFD